MPFFLEAAIERLRQRFPLVLLDEAQDTNGAQLALLDRVFGEDCAYQRLGDQNQTLVPMPALPFLMVRRRRIFHRPAGL